MNIFRQAGRNDAATLTSAYAEIMSLQYDAISDQTVSPIMRAVCHQYIMGHLTSHLWMARYGLRQVLVDALVRASSADYADSGCVSQYQVSRSDGTISENPPITSRQINPGDQHPGTAGLVIEDADLRISDS